jgi:hypothetical protein
MTGGLKMTNADAFPLIDVVEALSDQLREAQRRAAASDKPSVLTLKGCTVELALSWEKTGSAGIDFKVIKLDGGVDRTRMQTITLTMEPNWDVQLPMIAAKPVATDHPPDSGW